MKQLDCQHCGKVFSRKDGLHRHIAQNVCTKNNELLRCNDCGKTWTQSHANDYRNHVCKHKCPKCSKEFKHKFTLQRHMNEVNCGDTMEHESLGCDDCGQRWTRRQADKHRDHKCKWSYVCPLCESMVHIMCTQDDVCAECLDTASKLTKESWDPLCQGEFDSNVYDTINIKSPPWRSEFMQLGNDGDVKRLVAGEPKEPPTKKTKYSSDGGGFLMSRPRVNQWNMGKPVAAPTIAIQVTPDRSFTVPQSKYPTRLQILRYQYSSMNFEPLSASNSRPLHERIHEPISLACPSLNTCVFYPDIMSRIESFLSPVERTPFYDIWLDVDRHALKNYQNGAYTFCVHSNVWIDIQKHLNACRGKKHCSHLWKDERPMETHMFDTNADRYYWLFLSPQAAIASAHLPSRAQNVPQVTIPSDSQIQHFCTTMGMQNGPEPISYDAFRKLKPEDQTLLMKSIHALQASDQVRQTPAWIKLSPFLQCPDRYVPPKPLQETYKHKKSEEKKRQLIWEQTRAMRNIMSEKGIKLRKRKRLPRLHLDHPQLHEKHQLPMNIIHPLTSLCGPVRVIQRIPSWKDAIARSLVETSITTAETICSFMQPLEVKDSACATSLRTLFKSQIRHSEEVHPVIAWKHK